LAFKRLYGQPPQEYVISLRKGELTNMTIKEDQWVWIIVYGREGNEQMLGQHDSQADVSFIPCFLTKQEAINGLGHLTKDIHTTYTIQAIIFEELKQYAKEGGFVVFILKASGEIIERLTP
jgi:hypothetical protein